jgi:small subunit ribosomal protein S7
MSRRRREHKREKRVDARFGDLIVGKFINCMMWDGKKTTAEAIFYKALDRIEERFKEKGIDIFRRAMDNVRPVVEVRSRRVGGATYQVPTEVRPDRRNTLAIRWLVEQSRTRGERGMSEKLTMELFEAANNRGNAIKKREDTHRMAEANRAFAHFRW